VKFLSLAAVVLQLKPLHQAAVAPVAFYIRLLHFLMQGL
jgi:hypothetical protein